MPARTTCSRSKETSPDCTSGSRPCPGETSPRTPAPTPPGADGSPGTIKVADAPPWTGFTGAAQVAQIRRTRTVKGKKTIEVVYLITSTSRQDAPPAMLAAWIQHHWRIENRLHWVRDVSFDEDRSQVRTGNTPHVMASLRNIAIGLLRLAGWTNIAAGLRHHARNPQDAIKCLQAR